MENFPIQMTHSPSFLVTYVLLYHSYLLHAFTNKMWWKNCKMKIIAKDEIKILYKFLKC